MTQEPLDRDTALGEALDGIAADPGRERVDWAGLRRSVHERAASELARRRARYRRMRLAIPAAVAASFALFLLVPRAPEQTNLSGPAGPAVSTTAGQVTIDELLDADVSDGQFRALLFGATEADDLLLIAAQEDRP
jgi:hypothetical protein